ncbi:hypothetical protein SK069_04125 [Patulibacter brassicae]|uniref:DUF2269 family protein n=1 Tax=Patulibacter brassicae TaxID=1705717 RepID=A0ABU4VG28_9ACTN|nr:hypothetical protein [Patulibacter brassicae]MDX8150772.1 hypothetical protein [Patulibacter brassicae]
MTKLLLSLHVIAAIVCVGPVTLAASLFPRHARRASAGDPGDATIAVTMHRISRRYATLGVLVPVLGLATGAALGVLGDAWLSASILLTAAAAGVLVGLVLPGQERALAAPPPARLAMHAGLFNVLWAVVVVLMIVRPGSTTGA